MRTLHIAFFTFLLAISGFAQTRPGTGGGTNITYTTNLSFTVLGSNTVAAGVNVTISTNVTSSNIVYTVSSTGVSSTNDVIQITEGYFLTDIIYISTASISNLTNTGNIYIQPPLSAVQFNSNGVMQGSSGLIYSNGSLYLRSNAAPYLYIEGNDTGHKQFGIAEYQGAVYFQGDLLGTPKNLFKADQVTGDVETHARMVVGSVVTGPIQTNALNMSDGFPARIEYRTNINITAFNPVAIFFHGDGEDEKSAFEGYGKPVVDGLLAAGYIVASSSGGGPSLWGNTTTVNAYKTLYTYLTNNFRPSKMVFIGQSMGGVASLNLISGGQVAVDAWYGIVPVTSLYFAYTNLVQFSNEIQTAYGFSGIANFSGATTNHDPQMATNATFAGVRMRMNASYSDTVVWRAANSAAFAAKVTNTVPEVFITTSVGPHGDITQFNQRDVVSFFDKDILIQPSTKLATTLGSMYVGGGKTATPYLYIEGNNAGHKKFGIAESGGIVYIQGDIANSAVSLLTIDQTTGSISMSSSFNAPYLTWEGNAAGHKKFGITEFGGSVYMQGDINGSVKPLLVFDQVVGRAGIGTYAPLAMFTISNSTATTPSFQVFSSNNPVAAVTVLSNGYVGIGTASPLSPLTVSGVGGIVADEISATTIVPFDLIVGNSLLFQPGAGTIGQVLTSVDTAGTVGWSTPTGGSTTNITTTTVFVGTNTLYFTNECVSSANADTNHVIVSGAGTAGANGTYDWNAGAAYTNRAGVVGINFDGSDFNLTNSSGTTLYSNPDSFSASSWIVGGGAGPAPTSVFGTITNCVTVMSASSALQLPLISTNMYVDAAKGNDTNAVRGRLDRPWKTIDRALLDMRPGDRAIVGAGNYPLTDGASINLTNRCSIVGAGRGLTFIGTPQGAEDSLFLCSDTYLDGFTFQGKVVLGEGQQFTDTLPNREATNVYIRNVTINGASDGLGMDTWRNVVVEDSTITSVYDAVANWDNRALPQTAIFKNVTLLSIKTNNNTDTIHGISWLAGNLYFDGGSITASNGQTMNGCIYIPLSTNAPARMIFNGTRMDHGATNFSPSYVVINSNAANVLIAGTTPVEVMPPLINSIATNRTSEHIVGITNANSTHVLGRTNKLIDTTLFGTNGWLAGKLRVTIYDKTATASGTNIWIIPFGGQKINGMAIDSISTDNGSATYVVGGPGGTNWVREGFARLVGDGSGLTNLTGTFTTINAATVNVAQVNITNLPGTGPIIAVAPDGGLMRTNITGGFSVSGNSNQIPYVSLTGNSYLYGSTTKTNPGFGYSTSANSGLGALMIGVDNGEDVGYVQIGKANNGSQPVIFTPSLSISNTYAYSGSGSKVTQAMVRVTFVDQSDGSDPESFIQQWNHADAGNPVQLVAGVRRDGQILAGHGTYYPSNSLASTFPTAAQLGLGGYWVGVSNGPPATLVAKYSLDGVTVLTKVLAP